MVSSARQQCDYSVIPPRHLHIDGAKIEGTGFKCEVPEVTVELLREVSHDPTLTPHHATPHHATPHHAIPPHTMPHHPTPCHTTPPNTMPHHTTYQTTLHICHPTPHHAHIHMQHPMPFHDTPLHTRIIIHVHIHVHVHVCMVICAIAVPNIMGDSITIMFICMYVMECVLRNNFEWHKTIYVLKVGVTIATEW